MSTWTNTLRYTPPTPNDHQFRIEKLNGETIALRVSDEGIIIDIENETGEVIRSAYQFWCDLDELTWRSE